MIRTISIAILTLSSLIQAAAQSGDYFNLKDVRNFRFDHLELSNEKEIGQFLRNPQEFNFIEALKIRQTTELKAILDKSGICSYIKELDLSDYNGDLDASTFDSCAGIETLRIRISEEKLAQLQHLLPLRNLQNLYLYISGRPESLSGLSLLPRLRELHIIGEFLPKDLLALTVAIQNQTSLQVLGLSLDRITDLPQSITRFKTLSRLHLYDNLSVYANNGIEDLSEEKLSILFNLYSDMINAIAISYFSSGGKLADFETEYLQSLYKGELLPQQFEEREKNGDGSGNIDFDKEFIPDFPQSAEFSRPYSRLLPPGEIFTINPNEGSTLFSNSGMKINIAPGSFVNEAGETLSDPVYLNLTQLNNPVEFLFAGLNLKNGNRQFCSPFLFNLQASTEKSSARLKDGYQIRVQMPVKTDSALTYFFDYESNSWQDLNFYNRIFASNFTPLDFFKIETSSGHTAYFQFDSTRFSQRFGGRHHYLLNDRYNPNQLLFKKKTYYTDLDRSWLKSYNQDGKLKGIRIRRGKSYVKIQKVIPKLRNPERLYFKVLDKTEQGIIAELSAFRKINFNVAFNPENKKEFNENYIKNARYSDILIQYTPGREFCEITLKTIFGFKKLQAMITDSEDKAVIRKQLSRFIKAYRNYQRIRARRESEFNTLNRLRFDEFRVYSNERIQALQKENQFTEIKIQQLGTFGLMYDSEPVFSTNIIAQYTDESGLPVDVKDLFMIDSRYNTVFRIEAGNIAFDPEFCVLIVATDYSGNLYYANKNDVAASGLSNNSLIYIKLKRAGQNISTIQMFRQLSKN